MIKLVQYSPIYESETLFRISEFFGFHQSLTTNTWSSGTTSQYKNESQKTLSEWLVLPSVLFVLLDDDVSVGFIRICYRGANVAWIEDIFIDSDRRRQGIASNAIREAERIIMSTPGYTAVCLDVSPRNIEAMRLYHSLGYVDLSLITIRKEFGSSNRNEPIRILDLDFNY